MRQGRKFGFMIIGAVQNPLKEQVALRDLFTYFTGFRLAAKTATDIIFGQVLGMLGRIARRSQVDAGHLLHGE